nr:translocation/assembly module TamB domain-containing protein [bacterium]
AMNGTRLGNATGQFLYSENQVQVDELQLRNADTQCVVNGIVTLSDNPTVDLNVTLNPLQISEYTTLVSAPLDLKGQVFGEITLRGPVTALNGGGELVAHDMFASFTDNSNLRQVFSIPIEMKAPLKLKNGILQISDLTLKTTGGEFYISAVYNPNGEYEFQLNSGDLDLARILDEFGIKKIKGYGQLTANGKGMISKPQARVSIDLKSIQYADIKIGDIASKGYLDNNKIQFSAAAISDTFKLEGEVNAIHPMPFNVTMQLEKLDFGVLLEALPSSIYSLAVTDTPGGRVGGETTGIFNINGDMANVVNSRGTIQLQSVALQTPRHRFFNSKPIKIAFANQTVDVKQFELLQQMEGNPSLQSVLVMTGRIGPEKSDFTAQSDEFDLAILKDIISGQQPQSYFSVADISGLGKFKLHLTGSYFNPEFVFNWEFPEISVATSVRAYNNPPTPVAEVAKLLGKGDTDISSELDILKQNIPINSRGHLTYRDKLLTIDQTQLALYSNPIELKGVVPVDLTLFPVKSERSLQFIWQQRFSDSSMHIQLTSPNWDINFIEQFTPEIEKIDGYAKTNIEISGSPLNPKVSGNILLSDVSLKSPAIKQPLENLSAIINININPMNRANVPWLACTFDFLQWNIGQGRYSASGFVQYRQKTPPTEEITSWFDADFLSAIKESIAQPEIELTFQGDDMDLDAFVMDNGNDANMTGLPFDGRASMLATMKGIGMKLQDYTAQVEIEPLVLVVGDYGVQNDGKIKMKFQNGQIQLDSIILKSNNPLPPLTTPLPPFGRGIRGTLESTAELSLSGSVDLNGRFDLKMFMRQFNLKILSPFLKNVPHIDGLASIQLDANGTTAEPEASVSFDIQNIHVQDISTVVEDISIDAIKGSILLKNGTLTVNQTSLQAYDNELTFHGTIPLNLTKSGENSEPMQIFIKGEQINLAQFSALSEMVQELSGKAHLDMVLCSEPSLLPQSESTPFEAFMNPYLTGNLTMTEGRIKLASLNAPIELLKLDLVAKQAEPDRIGNEIRLNELSFQLGEGKYKMAAAIKMNGLMPQQYDGTLDIDKFQLELIDNLFLKETVLATETKKNLSGYLSVNAETKLNLGDLLNNPLTPFGKGDIPTTLEPEQKFWNLMGAAMGSKVTLPEIRIQIAGYPIYNQQPVTIFLNENMLSLPGCKLYYQSKSEDGFTNVNHAEDSIFLKAYGRWELNNPLTPQLPTPLDHDNQLAFEFMGFADTQMIAELTQLSDFLSELTASNNMKQPISGLIEYRASVRGSASEPRIKVSWPAADIALLGADVELLDSEIFYKNRAFNIKEIKLVTERTDIENIANINSILVTGQVPFNLSFMPYILSPSENELDLTISASIEKLDSLPLLAMQDATIDGNGEIKVKIGGTIQAPQFSDDITLKNVIYQYENVNVANTDVKLTLDSNSIIIEQVRGDFNGGSYQCSGKVGFDTQAPKGLSEYKLTDLDISGNWRDVEWEQEGIISLICEGSVQLLGTFDKPRLVGNVIVKNGIFEQSWQTIVKGILSKQPEGREEVILDYPLVKDLELDLNVQIPQEPDHFWLDTIGTKIQPQVNGRVVGPINPITRLVFVGRVDILEGEFSYFNRKFLIKTGTIENSSSYALDPRYKIDAEIATPIVGAKVPNTQETKDVKITLNMAGSLLSPQAPVLEAEVIKPDPGEQYDFDSLQILELLTFGSIVRQEGDAISFASETATDFIMRQAEIFVGAQIADTFDLRELQLGISDKNGSLPQFLITKEISPQWAVTYMSTYSLSTNPSLLSIEYKLDDNVSVAGTRNEYGKYGVDLKYGIEW